MTRFLPVCRFALSIWILMAAAAPLLAEQRVGEPARLTVVSAAPDGEIADREEANEIRVVFSEPMVVLGRIPAARVINCWSDEELEEWMKECRG